VHDTTKPQGVRGRNSDNTRLRSVLQWEPQMMLREGIVPTYRWIAEQTADTGAIVAAE
jgi:nucleoside-diphosphate-sugar epimerase